MAPVISFKLVRPAQLLLLPVTPLQAVGQRVLLNPLQGEPISVLPIRRRSRSDPWGHAP